MNKRKPFYIASGVLAAYIAEDNLEEAKKSYEKEDGYLVEYLFNEDERLAFCKGVNFKEEEMEDYSETVILTEYQKRFITGELNDTPTRLNRHNKIKRRSL